jgi:hypothetical protein
MWFVETPQGLYEQVHNRATAEYLAREYSTRYMDGVTNSFFTPIGDDDE